MNHRGFPACYSCISAISETREGSCDVGEEAEYIFLDTDDEDHDDGDRSSAQVVYESRKADYHKKRFRKKILRKEDEDDEIQSLSKQQGEGNCICNYLRINF
ncbi:hypothetical protein Pyn_20814 [Prunus yedoensis var. nudiflora]|uniref:Uncharacterized protein n=1 Tax=Prunus yedoensis var. nudiflora TaxID=2094558 RepID=A0A314YQU4_PRUYE|nr:hypothetical protein Pyn_20814 [Prunus yedoensis var. nudiflora]